MAQGQNFKIHQFTKASDSAKKKVSLDMVLKRLQISHKSLFLTITVGLRVRVVNKLFKHLVTVVFVDFTYFVKE